MKDILNIKPAIRELQEKTEALLNQLQIAENTIIYYDQDQDKEVGDNVRIDKIPNHYIVLDEHFQAMVTRYPEILQSIIDSQKEIYKIHELIISLKSLALKRHNIEGDYGGYSSYLEEHPKDRHLVGLIPDVPDGSVNKFKDKGVEEATFEVKEKPTGNTDFIGKPVSASEIRRPITTKLPKKPNTSSIKKP